MTKKISYRPILRGKVPPCLTRKGNLIPKMCRSSQCPSYSTENQSETESKAARLFLRGRNQNDNFRILERKGKDLGTSSDGKYYQDLAISRSVNEALSTKSVVYQLPAQDLSVALATFPEFFSQGLASEHKVLTKRVDPSLTNQDFNDRKRNLSSEYKGLALWYIREYGL
ncbi:unnamed protein product [Pocillopora meandrina]|uniref:Uncharacterized protein n=1 Tax=Pocillopora meandrina TaxID=46732 RepID=A0AAU9W3V6_9CNID|nr:unnamed protein product [Pocillopora meandrina]